MVKTFRWLQMLLVIFLSICVYVLGRNGNYIAAIFLALYVGFICVLAVLVVQSIEQAIPNTSEANYKPKN